MLITFKVNSFGDIRKAVFNSKEFIVVPMVALVEGLLKDDAGSNFLVPGDQIVYATDSWNGRPLTLNHPTFLNPYTGRASYVPANSPDMLEKFEIGKVFNAQVVQEKNSTGQDVVKLKVESWIDPTRLDSVNNAADLIERFNSGEQVEVSTGFFSRLDQTNGFYNGSQYDYSVIDLKPDHIAILQKGLDGRCDWSMGCGLRANSETYIVKDVTMDGKTNTVDQKGQPLNVNCGGCANANSANPATGVADASNVKANSADDSVNIVINKSKLSQVLSLFGLGPFLKGDASTTNTSSPTDIGLVTNVDGNVTKTDSKSEPKSENDKTSNQLKTNSEDNMSGINTTNNTNKSDADKAKEAATMKQNSAQTTQPDQTKVASADSTVGAADAAVLAELAASKREEEVKTNSDNTTKVTPVTPMTMEQFMSSAPPEIAAVLKQGVALRNNAAKNMIKVILENKNNKLSELQLNAMPFDTLEAMYSLAKVEETQANYAGMGGQYDYGTNSKRNDEFQAPEAPRPFDPVN